MRILIVTDAWEPQVNGVVNTLRWVTAELARQGHAVGLLTPRDFRSLPCPTYPEIRLALTGPRGVARRIEAFAPEAIHIATEGPLGHLARRYCRRRRLPFTTAFHTQFPEYIHARVRLPVSWSYRYMRAFHRPAARTMVATAGLRRRLEGRGFEHLAIWGRGVDLQLFKPGPKSFLDLPRPIFLYVGRVAVEKNLRPFLDLPLEGSKLVVGDGPSLEGYRRSFPDVEFVGAKFGQDLANHFAAADVFVFPSRTDTFGLVLLEALASGLPVAAYPVTGPLDVINGADVGVLDEDLAVAARRALAIPAARCRTFAERFSWQASAAQFLGNLAPFSEPQPSPLAAAETGPAAPLSA